MIPKELKFRPYKKEDLNFVSSSWGYSYFNSGLQHKNISPNLFHKFHRPIRNNILNRSTATIIICCARSDEDLIVGWVCVERVEEQIILHYVYVKDAFRYQGIASELVNAVIPKDIDALFSHNTHAAREILSKMKDSKRFQFTPHLI